MYPQCMYTRCMYPRCIYPQCMYPWWMYPWRVSIYVCSMPIRMKHVSIMHACVMHVKNGDGRTDGKLNSRRRIKKYNFSDNMSWIFANPTRQQSKWRRRFCDHYDYDPNSRVVPIPIFEDDDNGDHDDDLNASGVLKAWALPTHIDIHLWATRLALSPTLHCNVLGDEMYKDCCIICNCHPQFNALWVVFDWNLAQCTIWFAQCQ